MIFDEIKTASDNTLNTRALSLDTVSVVVYYVRYVRLSLVGTSEEEEKVKLFEVNYLDSFSYYV